MDIYTRIQSISSDLKIQNHFLIALDSMISYSNLINFRFSPTTTKIRIQKVLSKFEENSKRNFKKINPIPGGRNFHLFI